MYLRLLYAGPSLYAGKTYAPPEVSISGGVGGVWAAARWNTMDEKGMLKDVQFLFSVASMRPSSRSPYTFRAWGGPPGYANSTGVGASIASSIPGAGGRGVGVRSSGSPRSGPV